MESKLILDIITFTLLQLVNVFLSTTKTVIQIKSTKLYATIANSVYYAFYTVVVIFMVASFPIWIKVIVTFVCNMIGTWCSMTLLEKLKKDKLWKIEVTVPTKNIKAIDLELKEVPHSYIIITTKHTVFTFYCATSEQSKKVRDVIKKYDAKYFVSESRIMF